MKKDLYLEQFDKYESGQMSGKERTEFETQLNENQEIMKSFNLYKFSLDAIETDIERNLRSTLKSWDSEESSNKSKGVVPFRRRALSLGAAASALLLIGFLTFQFMGSGDSVTGQQLFAEMYEVPKISTMRDSGTNGSVLDKGADAFTSGNFSEAIIAYSEISKDDPDYWEGQYLAGHAAVALEDYDRASQFFSSVLKSGDRNLIEKGEWYYLMSLAASGKVNDSFHAMLNKIRNTGEHSFGDKAEALSAQLD